MFFKQITRHGYSSKISWTQKVALRAGPSGIEKQFFTGQPNFKKILAPKMPSLTNEEQDFINTKVNKLCAMCKEWDVLKNKKLSQQTEDF